MTTLLAVGRAFKSGLAPLGVVPNSNVILRFAYKGPSISNFIRNVGVLRLDSKHDTVLLTCIHIRHALFIAG